MELFFFFFNDTATTEIYTLSLHDALPIYTARADAPQALSNEDAVVEIERHDVGDRADRKSTRLNSSHSQISYAVFCLKKKKRWDGSVRTGNALCCRTYPTPPASVL